MPTETKPSHRERIRGGYEGHLLFIISLATMSGMGAQLLLSPLLPAIIADLSISPTVAGFGLSIMWACTAIFHYPGGRLSDISTRKTLLVPSIGMILIGLATFVIVPELPAFFIGLTVLGIGVGVYTPVAFAQLSDLYTRRRGLAIGINTASLNLGGMLGAGLTIISLQFLSWREAFIPIGLVLFLVLVLLHRHSNEQYRMRSPDFDFKNTLFRLTRGRELKLALLAAVLFGFTWQAILSFLPTYLQASKGFTVTIGGILFGTVFFVGILTTPIVGRLGDQWEHIYVAILTSMLTAIGLCLLIIGEDIITVAGGIIVLAIGLSGFWPAVNTYLMSIFPHENIGGDYGATRTVFIASESIGPLYLGFMGEHFSYSLGFSSLLLPLIFTIGITVTVSTISSPN